MKLLIIVGTVSAGTDDQLEQLQLAFLQVPDLKLHGRQAHRLFFSGKDCRNTGFHRVLGCLHPEQFIHGGDDPPPGLWVYSVFYTINCIERK